MSVVTVCKNIIAQNNKRGWVDPEPTIRVSGSPGGAVQFRAHKLAITDSAGNVVAELIATRDGNPVVKCGAKVALITKHPVLEVA